MSPSMNALQTPHYLTDSQLAYSLHYLIQSEISYSPV